MGEALTADLRWGYQIIIHKNCRTYSTAASGFVQQTVSEDFPPDTASSESVSGNKVAVYDGLLQVKNIPFYAVRPSELILDTLLFQEVI